MGHDLPYALLLISISPAVGSFLAVLVDRLVIGRSVVFAPSSCAACGVRLAWRDMVPVLSFFTLKGRCRWCGAAIPGHLFRIEIAATCAALMAVALVPGVGQMWLMAGILWCLISLFYSDLLHLRLPNTLTAALLVLGLMWAFFDPFRGAFDGFLSAGIGFFGFWIIRACYSRIRGREGMGLGDVKLMAGVGAVVGWQAIPLVTLIASLLALLIALASNFRADEAVRGDTRIPFGSFLCAGTVLVILI